MWEPRKVWGGLANRRNLTVLMKHCYWNEWIQIIWGFVAYTTLLMLQCTRRESLRWLISGFLNLCSTGILDQIILCCRGLSLYIVGYLATLLASTNSMPVAFSLVETTKNVSQHCQMSPKWQNNPQLKTTGLDGITKLPISWFQKDQLTLMYNPMRQREGE